MNRHKWQRLLYSLAGLVVVAGVTYACKGFLDQPAQGTVDQATLMHQAGRDGELTPCFSGRTITPKRTGCGVTFRTISKATRSPPRLAGTARPTTWRPTRSSG